MDGRMCMRVAAFACLFLTTVAAWGQAQVSVRREVANMGEIAFRQPAQVQFTLLNSGDQPLFIDKVIPACGCTTVDWTRAAVNPGEEGIITAIYDAKTLGVFQKDLEVYTSASDAPLYLHLQGRVVAHQTQDYGSFPIDLDNLRLNTNHVVFDDVNRGDRPTVELQVVNMSRESYTPYLMHLPPYLSAQYVPETLNGGRIGRILLTLDSEQVRDMGLTQASIYLARCLGDKIGEENEIKVSVVLLPGFSQRTATELALAPRMVLSVDSLNLGTKGKGQKTGLIVLRNEGKQTLEISSLQVFDPAIGVELSNKSIAPGEAAELKVSLQTKHLNTMDPSSYVLLISNDPMRAKQIIKINVDQ